jgi:acetyl esterase/lipase
LDDAFHAFDEPAQLRSLKPWREPTFRDVQYAVVEGFRPLLLDLTVPESTDGRLVPVVVCVHGGGWATGTNKVTPDDYIGYPTVWEAFYQRGLAVASIQYRHSSEALFPAQLHDVKAATRWLRRYGAEIGLDAGRIGVWGESAGGHLAALLAMNTTDDDLEGTVGVVDESSTVDAAVCWFAVSDLTTLQQQSAAGSWLRHDRPDSFESRLIGGVVESNRDAARRASPVSYVNPSAAPLLLMHGDADEIVALAQSEQLRDALDAVGAQVQLVTVPGADHCFLGVDLAPLAELTAAELASRLHR